MRNLFSSKKENNIPTFSPYNISILPNFQLSGLQNKLSDFLKETSKKEYQVIVDKGTLSVKTEITIDTKKNKKSYTQYAIAQKANMLTVIANKTLINLDAQEEINTPIDLFTKKNTLVAYILTHVNELFEDGFWKTHQQLKMEYITSISPIEKNYILAKLQKQEVCLVCLGITNLKSDLFEINKKNNYYFVLTSERNLIFGTDNKSFLLENITGHTLNINEKVGKDTITSDRLSFDTELFNDSLFADLKEILNQSSTHRIEYYTDILFEKYNEKEAHLQHLEKLYQYQTSKEDRFKRNLKAQLVYQFEKKQCNEQLVVKPSFLDLLYSETDFGNTLFHVLNDWNIHPKEQITFLELLIKDVDNFKLKNLDVFYDAAIAGIITQKKPPKNTQEYRIKHLQYLKETKQYEKAIPFYEFVLENLEDDSILELISDTETNVLDGQDCHPLRIQLLEDLSEIKTSLQLSNSEELLELARLQPLVLDRLTQLVASGIFVDKVNDILSLFMEESFSSTPVNKTATDTQKQYSKKELFELVVPDCFKDAKSFLDSFTNMIAQVNPPDYKEVTTYSEKLSASNFPEAQQILEELMYQLQLDKMECYIGNGNFSKEVIGIEGSPNFLILGKDHLLKNNAYYFTPNELKFNLTLELTHILFEHTRITSKDIWRGAKSKGMDLAGVLLIALPMVSTLGNFAGKFINITQYTKIFSSVDQVTNVVDKGQTALEYGEKITDKFTNNKKESELLATSRLMEISADRIGLLLTNDLRSCVSVLLKTSDDFAKSQEKINTKGLLEYLGQKNKKGEFIHQELIIRIKTLCSFHLRESEKI
ncbi:hypothetical protein D1818_18525 [Aquimarina sp. BL5]|uniref:hypothetical protein n=1 Tax=Aquimarina sp. BL5 TaxID=1714860 RepID=UPI000E4F4FA4|nr:hypothetical protein [Aquimarina sp. BL5]AXT52720.1 hypothetical protein D1818_18525 [Aquimarina sp. BL5]RKN08306.1 hypothetical protein D7036_06135 [Aquimarina sp. BL5]